MLKLSLAAAVLLIASPALADSWNITEEAVSGIKSAQGKWDLKNEGGKVTGVTEMQLHNGNPLTYKIEGTANADGTYTLNFNERSDGKKDCVWTGHAPQSGAGLIGDVMCGGKKTMIIRAGILK